jgi:hypothetical protein
VAFRAMVFRTAQKTTARHGKKSHHHYRLRLLVSWKVRMMKKN